MTRPGPLALPPLALAAALAGGCATAPTTVATTVVVDPQAPPETPSADLPILRQKAAMGRVDSVRAELAPRLAAAPAGSPDAGRDALRALAVELALVQDDQPAALRELAALARELDVLGDRASREDRARWHTLHGACLFAQQRFAEARSQDLQALALLDLGPRSTPLVGDALAGLARDQLALGEPVKALTSVRRALAVHKDSLAVLADRVLAVDIMIALGEPSEAVITAGKAYDDALLHVGPDTLAHAEALLAAASATLASGDHDAARSFLTDAHEIWSALQSARTDPERPVSVRVARRLAALDTALAAPNK